MELACTMLEKNSVSNLTKLHLVKKQSLLSSRSSAVRDQRSVNGREELDVQESIL
ncbi:hypothetical protein C0J52_14245 [Blattella germanica]|nr:hypothetical protein C0J52_14245 [Blattella germanica]